MSESDNEENDVAFESGREEEINDLASLSECAENNSGGPAHTTPLSSEPSTSKIRKGSNAGQDHSSLRRLVQQETSGDPAHTTPLTIERPKGTMCKSATAASDQFRPHSRSSNYTAENRPASACSDPLASQSGHVAFPMSEASEYLKYNIVLKQGFKFKCCVFHCV